MKYKNEEDTKKDFAKLFGWQKRKGQYDYGEPDYQTPTWAEIFAEGGKLLKQAGTLKDEWRINTCENRISNLESVYKKD